MPKKQMNIRASLATQEKIAYLAQRYGTIAEAIAVAVDRLYRSEQETDETLQNCTSDQA